MAKIKIEGVLESLDYDLKIALKDTVDEYTKQPTMSDKQLYKVFIKKAYSRCSTWEQVPDRYIKAD